MARAGSGMASGITETARQKGDGLGEGYGSLALSGPFIKAKESFS